MKKTTIIAVIAVIILIAAVFYFVSRSVPAPERVYQEQMAIIKDAFLGTGSAVCTFPDHGYDEWDDDEITIYIKGGNVRFFSEKGVAFEGDMLLKDNVFYIWQDKEGIKMPMEDDRFLPFGVENGELYLYVDEFDEPEVQCRRTSIDDSMFDVPGDVDFLDLSDEHFYFEDFDVEDYEYQEYDYQGIVPPGPDVDLEEYYRELYESMGIDPEDFEGIENWEDFEMY